MADEQPTKEFALQLIRNRIIESLELASSFKAQRRYQIDVPIANVPAEVICNWEDQVDQDRLEQYGPPVFSSEEIEAMRTFQQAWEVITGRLPRQLSTLEKTQELPEWDHLRDAAAKALKAFATRGKLSEDHEI
jgi:hypothetical protein